MQKLALQPHKGTKALQPHCHEQSATELNSPNGKALILCSSNVYRQCTYPQEVYEQSVVTHHRVLIRMHTAHEACFLLMQVLHCVLHMFMALCMLMPLLTASTWLFMSMYATDVSVYTIVIENRQPNKCVPSPQVMQICVIFLFHNMLCTTIEHNSKRHHVHLHTGALHAHCGCRIQLSCKTHWITACL